MKPQTSPNKLTNLQLELIKLFSYDDTAISANVDYLVTNDRHFNVLKTIDFPKVTICKAQEFKEIVLGE